MKNVSIIFLIIIINFVYGGKSEKVSSSRYDDVKCEVQLKYFSEALSLLETWAVESKMKKKNLLTFVANIFQLFFHFFWM